MPTTYVLFIAAPSSDEPDHPRLHTKPEQDIVKAYLQNECTTEVKVCYVSQAATPQLQSSQFLGNLESLLQPIKEDDWLIFIYSGIYSKIPEEINLFPLSKGTSAPYCFTAPFRDTPYLLEHDLVSHLQQHYSRNRFRTFVIIDAYFDRNKCSLQDKGWDELETVVLVGERNWQPLLKYESEGLLINSLFQYLLDIETNLKKRAMKTPTIHETYTRLKESLKESELLACSDDEDSQDDSEEEEEDNESSASSDEQRKPHMRLFYSKKGIKLLFNPLPI